MEIVILVVVLAFSLFFVLLTVRQSTIFERERGLLYRDGKFLRVLDPGRHWYFRPTQMIRKVDVRTQFVSVGGQEILSSDNVSLKVSLAASYRIHDPHLAIDGTANYLEALYILLQVQLRDLFGETPVDELLAKRKEIGETLRTKTAERALEIGVELLSADLKDIMFPGELKTIFAQVVNARKEGLAALERARGESAALRNLANAAQLLESNPGLLQLRLLQTLSTRPGNTIILTSSMDEAIPLDMVAKHTSRKHQGEKPTKLQG